MGAGAWARALTFHRDRFNEHKLVLLVLAGTRHGPHLRLEALLARAERHRSEVPRSFLSFVTKRLIGRIVHTWRHSHYVLFILELAFIIVIEPSARISSRTLH